MKTKYAFVSVALFGMLHAAAASSFPNSWMIANDTAEEIQVKCRSTKTAGNLNIVMDTKTIAANARATHEWGDAWYNDGLGLNKATWECSVNGNTSTSTFASEWDENLALRVQKQNARFVMSKVPLNSDVAKKEESRSPSAAQK